MTAKNPAAAHFSGLFSLLPSRFPAATSFVWVEHYQLAGCYILAQFLDRVSAASVHDYKSQLPDIFIFSFWGCSPTLLLCLIYKCCCIAVLGVPLKSSWRWNLCTNHPVTRVTSLVKLQMVNSAQAFMNCLFKEAVINFPEEKHISIGTLAA